MLCLDVLCQLRNLFTFNVWSPCVWYVNVLLCVGECQRVYANALMCLLVLGRMNISIFEGSIVKMNECSNVCFTWFVQLIMESSLNKLSFNLHSDTLTTGTATNVQSL